MALMFILQLVYLCGYVSGVLSLVTVHQPPVLTAALGGDTIMPCELQLSHDEKMVSTPVLYWHYLQQESNKRLWQPSEPYKGRVQLLDDNKKSWNKSIVLKEVQWADSGRYECKLTVTTQREGSFRKKGNLTSLAVHGKYKIFLCFLLFVSDVNRENTA
uniref:Ig-like domain-containing protein n=1 Tax=Amphiprion ocellaris TaxID=80972 RepID=A0AAQ5YMD9_AMPOC